MGPLLACEVCSGLTVWTGPSGFQKSSNNQSLRPRSLLIRGGTLTASALPWTRFLVLQAGCQLAALPQQHGSDWGMNTAPPG